MYEDDEWYYDYPDQYDPSGDEEDDLSDFADPGGNSALRAETPDNPRIYPCPDCSEPDRLTLKDVQLGYCCNSCADQKERGF